MTQAVLDREISRDEVWLEMPGARVVDLRRVGANRGETERLHAGHGVFAGGVTC